LSVTSAQFSFGGTLENAVGQVRQIFFHTGDAQIKINLVVIGRNIAVADGPILAIAVAVFALKS